MYVIRQHGSATAFLEAVEPMLLEREAEHCLLLGVTASLSKQEQTGKEPVMHRRIEPGALMMTVEKGGETLACAVRTPPFRLILPHAAEDALHALADHVAELDPRLPGVLGPSESGSAFARRWSSITGAEVTPSRSMRILRLDRIEWPAQMPSGSLREAEVADTDQLERWIYAFGEEIGEPQDGRELARARIEDRSLFVWDDGGPRSMAATARRSRNGCSVNLVYTPPDHRRRGYASACVASLSERILASGFTHCSLYTDDANPTSNHIYDQIGYRPIGDSRAFDFVAAKARVS